MSGQVQLESDSRTGSKGMFYSKVEDSDKKRKEPEVIACPEWVKKQGKCEEYLFIKKQALDYADVLESKYEIEFAGFKNDVIYLTIKRGELRGQVTISAFTNIEKINIKGNEVEIVYKKINVHWERFKGSLAGIGASGIVMLIVLIVILL